VGYSKIYLGSDIAHENDIVRAVGKDVSSLHVRAQRVAWGILMGERLGVDLDKEVDTLLARHHDEPMAHVTAAIARSSQGRNDDAAKHLERAREQSRPDHPWHSLVERAQSLSTHEHVQRLEETEVDRVYRVAAVRALAGIDSANINVATFIRMKSGELTCINPVAMTDDIVARVKALGDVTNVIAPAKYHNENVRSALAAFPKAKAWGVPGHEGYDLVKDIPFTGLLRDDAPLFPGEIDQITMHGLDLGDVWLLDRASKSLLVTDAILAPAKDYMTPFAAFYRWAWGLDGRDLAIPSYQPPMWKDLKAYQASVRRAFEQDFVNVASNHGSWHCAERKALASAYEWFLDLSKVDGVRLVADFAWRHPNMTYRFIKEQIAVARAKRATTSGA
jgi:hypothetical protein